MKYHEQKLLKKVDFINWEPKVDNSLHEVFLSISTFERQKATQQIPQDPIIYGLVSRMRGKLICEKERC